MAGGASQASPNCCPTSMTSFTSLNVCLYSRWGFSVFSQLFSNLNDSPSFLTFCCCLVWLNCTFYLLLTKSSQFPILFLLSDSVTAAAAFLEIEIIINEAKLSNLSLEMMKFQWFTQMPTAAIKTCVLRQLSTIDTGIVQKCWYYFPSKESHMSLTQETPRLQLRRLFNIWLQHFWRVISKKEISLWKYIKVYNRGEV